MKKILLAGVTALAALAASPAAAEVTIIGGPATTVAAALEDPDGSGAFTIAFSDALLGATFSETLTFENDMAGLYSAIVSTTANTDEGPNDVDFTSVFLTGTGIMGQIDLTQQFASDLNEVFAVNNVLLDMGTFTLTFQGNAGTNGGFGGNVSFLPSAVPEPATWAMMLVGFGAVGYSMRSRKAGYRLAQAV